MNFNNLTESDLNLLSIYMLMFADDIARFTTDKSSLQSLLDSLYVYSTEWGLTINVKKNKICIFEKGRQSLNYDWFINNEIVEVVDSFTYLGIYKEWKFK